MKIAEIKGLETKWTEAGETKQNVFFQGKKIGQLEYKHDFDFDWGWKNDLSGRSFPTVDEAAINLLNKYQAAERSEGVTPMIKYIEKSAAAKRADKVQKTTEIYQAIKEALYRGHDHSDVDKAFMIVETLNRVGFQIIRKRAKK